MAFEDDADLVASFVRGEPGALALVNRWIAAAAMPFRHRLNAEWEDLLQEIRIEAFRLLQAGAFRGDSRLRTYLSRVACHTCLDAVRRNRRRTFVGLEEIDALPAGGPTPLEAMARRQAEVAALRALATLSTECRELWRKLLAGLSYREIEAETGVAEGALRVRAHRCRKAAADAYRAAGARGPREDERVVR